MKWGRPVTALVAVMIMLSAPAKAGPIVNEVLANEPGGLTSLEWIELYNNTDNAVSMSGVQLDIGGDRIVILPADLTLAPHEYFIVCRRLYTEGASAGFESVWGDNSGFWGDAGPEMYLREPLEAAFSLPNAGGYVALVDSLLGEISRLGWSSSGADGVSWERVTPESDSIAQSIDPRGATPGAVNSVMPVAHDLALRLLAVRSVDHAAQIDIAVYNHGTEQSQESWLAIGVCLDSLCAQPSPIDSIDIPPLSSNDSCILSLSYSFPVSYTELAALLPPDDRPDNNRVSFIAPGDDYPPLLLSEFLANPDGTLETEWIELYNRADSAVDLYGWRIGDSRTTASITLKPASILDAGSYVVLIDDSVSFRRFYPGVDALILQPSPWPTLNNSGDSIRLIGPFDIEADRFSYANCSDSNRTWCRSFDTDPPSAWGFSLHQGGTPGEANEVTLPGDESGINLRIRPKVFSPERDIVTITVDGAILTTVRIFDRQGRVVRHFDSVNESVEWDGRSDSGRRLLIGPYIVVAESETGESAREVVVIAR